MGDPDPPGPPVRGLCREIETTLLLLLLLSRISGGQWALRQEGLNRRRVCWGWETWQDGDLGVCTSVGGQSGACHLELLILRLGRGHGL